MEALLQHLRDFGMSELSFIIINSKLPISMLMIHKLKDRVSIPVYQETDEEEVWSVMEGGKDDMFIYDRCGRLAYHIPFPLSVIHEEQPIVQAAILSTYFQNPCGTSCTENATFVINALDEEIPQEDIKHSNVTNETVHVEDDFAAVENSTVLEDQNTPVNDYPDYYQDIFYVNSTAENNETLNAHDNNTNIESTTPANNDTQMTSSLLTSLLKFLLNIEEASSTPTEPEVHHSHVETNSEKATLVTNDDNKNMIYPDTNISEKLPYTNETDVAYNLTDRVVNDTEQERNKCTEVGKSVCEEWSKNRLLQAQRCCTSSIGTRITFSIRTDSSCRNFGKKRCAKMQPLIKCCLKTGMVQGNTPERSTQTPEHEERM